MKNKKLLISITAIALVAVIVSGITLQTGKNKLYQPRSFATKLLSQNIKGAVQWLALLRNDPATGTVDPTLLFNARKLVDLMQANQTKTIGLDWEEMGPNNVGGRCRAILFDVNNPSIMYAGGVGGGLWRSTTSGTSWVKVVGISDNLAVTSIAQAPTGEIYVGTGEGLAQPSGINFNTGQVGGGIYKSTDGINYAVLPNAKPTLPITSGNINSINWALINRMAVSPVTGVIYAATTNALKMSSDGGTTWKSAKGMNGPLLATIGGCTDVKAASDGTIAVATGSSIYISNTGADSTFIKRSGGVNQIPASGVGRVEVAIAPSNTNIIYACAAASDGSLFGVYKSEDKGLNWLQIAPGGSANLNVFGDNKQGWYDNVIAVSPIDPNKVFVGGIDMWEGVKIQDGAPYSWTNITEWFNETSTHFVHADHHAYVFHPTNPNVMFVGCDGGIFRTQDEGLTFAPLNKNFNVTQFYAVAASYNGSVMGGTQDNSTPYINFNGNDSMAAKVLFGGDGGAAAFSTIHSKALFVSTYNGQMGRSSDNGNVFSKYEEMFTSRWVTLSGTTYTWNFGASFVTPLVLWESISDLSSPDSITYKPTSHIGAGTNLTLRSGNVSYPFNYTTAIALDSGSSYRIQDPVQAKLFLGIQGGVLMTRKALDFSKTPVWMQICKFYNNDVVQSLAYTRDGNTLFVGTQGGTIYRISNISASIDSLNSDFTSSGCVITKDSLGNFGRPITSVSVDPNDANRVTLTLGSYGNYTSWIYLSENATAANPTFAAKQGNLPQMPVYASLIVLNHPNEVIIGTEYGMFATSDISVANPVWTIENGGQFSDKVPVFMITQQTNNFPFKTVTTLDPSGNPVTTTFAGTSNYGTIYIASHGRGIFACKKYLGISKYQSTADEMPTLKVYPNPVSDFANINFTIPQSGNVMINIYDLSGRIVKSQDMGHQAKGTNKYTLDCTGFQNGTYIVQMISGAKKVSGKFIVNK
ncbi:MAG: T9SS type A sorting domain-containing protein [Bacteroidota bacterium]